MPAVSERFGSSSRSSRYDAQRARAQRERDVVELDVEVAAQRFHVGDAKRC